MNVLDTVCKEYDAALHTTELISKSNILVVDDNSNNLKLVRNLLNDYSYKIRLATGGDMALKSCFANPPDLILLDVNMPDVDGYQVCKQLKENQETRNIPVIFLSAANQLENKTEGFSIGAVDYITKPFQSAELIARIHTHLTNYHLSRKVKNYSRELEKEIEKSTHELKHLNEELKKRGEELSRQVIERSEQLNKVQTKLLQQEKMVSLGNLVAGIAHEMNTPIGNALTVSSTLKEKTNHFYKTMKNGALKRAELDTFLEDAITGAGLIEKNINLAADLINKFKQVAVDQSSERRRKFDLKEVIDEVIWSLTPSFKHTRHKIHTDIQEGITMDSYPGPLGQVITNFVNNSIFHGFKETEAGEISIVATLNENNQILLIYHDDGCGIPKQSIDHVFEPFFTTALGTGGSGLGLNLVYNIVTGLLEGGISVSSEINSGVSFTLTLPPDTGEPDECSEVLTNQQLSINHG